MPRIAICDDAADELEHIYNLAAQYASENTAVDFTIQKFQASYDLLDCIQNDAGFDLYLLDILMPGIGGISLAERIRKNDQVRH